MTPKLELAEHYYAVARDLERQGQFMLNAAQMCNALADQYCEQNMREQPAKSPAAPEATP